MMYAKKARRSKPKRSPRNSKVQQQNKKRRHNKKEVTGIAPTLNPVGQLSKRNGDSSSSCKLSKLPISSLKKTVTQKKECQNDINSNLTLSPPDLAAGWTNQSTNSSSSFSEPSLTKVLEYVSEVNLKEREKDVCSRWRMGRCRKGDSCCFRHREEDVISKNSYENIRINGWSPRERDRDRNMAEMNLSPKVVAGNLGSNTDRITGCPN